MYGFMFHALQAQAKKSGYMLLHIDDSMNIAVVDLVNERLVSVEEDLEEAADLLGGICIQSAEERAKKLHRVD